MTTFIICLFAFGIVVLFYNSKGRKLKEWHDKNVKTNVAYQDYLEKKYLVQVINDLREIDTITPLYGATLLEAFKSLYSKYKVYFPDVRVIFKPYAEKRPVSYVTEDVRYRDAWDIMNEHLDIYEKHNIDKAFVTKYPLECRIYENYLSPPGVSPVLNNPSLLFTQRFLYIPIIRSAKTCYFDKDGREVIRPSTSERKQLWRFKYDHTSRRLLNFGGRRNLWLYLLDELIICMTREELKKRDLVYRESRVDSQRSIDEATMNDKQL